MASSAAKNEVRVRLAPSPTGPMHVGTARTALFNWLFARQHKGVFILRIEDTDLARSEKKYESEIFEGLSWLGLDWDEGPIAFAQDKKLTNKNDRGDYGPYRQSERTHVYREYLEKLLAEKKAYFCYCTKEELESERQFMLSQGLPPKYGGHCRNLESPPAGHNPQVIRFKVAEKKVEFKDLIHGKVSFDAALFGDIVISRVETPTHEGRSSDRADEMARVGEFTYLPLFNFVVVIDDALMKITHVIRGEDHLSNTPKQILIFEAFGFAPPVFAHMPLFLNADRSKMSKRTHDAALLEYREKGYLPDALVNFLALLGWHPKDDREFLTRDELLTEFDLQRVQKSGAIFNQDKLDWLNREYLKRMSDDDFFEYGEGLLKERGMNADPGLLRSIFNVERNRIKNFDVFKEQFSFFFALPEYSETLLVATSSTIEKTRAFLGEIESDLRMVPDASWREATIKTYLEKISEQEGRGNVYWPFRIALSGQQFSPDPLEIAEILGKEESLRRIAIALKKLAT